MNTRLSWPVPEDLDPAQIVAALHAEIAAMGPERAALVAAFEAIPRKPGLPVAKPRPAARPGTVRHRRHAVYTSLRLGGTGLKAAARRAGITPRSGQQYEADLIGILGGAVS
jgi:hypothetical protein